MQEIDKLEKRYKELASRPKSKEEVDETLELAKKIDAYHNKEISLLIEELAAKGIVITSIWDLVNSGNNYPEAIDALIDHLPKNYRDGNKEGLIRALTVKEAKGKAAKILIQEYYKTPVEKKEIRWAIGNAISKTMTKDDLQSVLEIVRDKGNGISREMFVYGLGAFKAPNVEETLIDLLNDDEVASSALNALGRLKSQKAKGKIKDMALSSNTLIKTEALKALKKIN